MTSADERGSSQAFSMPGPRTLRQAQGMLHGSGERASHPGHGERRHPSGDRTPQAGGLRREDCDLKQLGADLSLEVHRFKRTVIPAFDGAERPGEVERHKPGGRDPVGKTEVTHPTAGAQE